MEHNMDTEFDTSAEAGTEDVQPEQTDNVPNYVYHDPEEDTVAEAQDETTEDDGTVETHEDPEEAETETDDTPETEVFELPDGTTVERDEAVKGYLRQSDYSRKAAEVADMRKATEAENQALKAETTRLTNITEALVTELSKMIPAAPDASLAYSDPTAYNQQRAAHEAAASQVEALIKLGEQAKETSTAIDSSERQRTIADENRKLAQAFPQTASPKGRDAFFAEAGSAAQEIGFSAEELSGTTDHRLFKMAYWASKGMKAEQAKAKAKQKVAKAPPAARSKPGQVGNPTRNVEAMKTLTRSGSIRDAMAIDFD